MLAIAPNSLPLHEKYSIMVKRAHCLFIISLLGTACMAGPESNIATEKPKEIKGNKIPKRGRRHLSKKKDCLPVITLKEDITKHPVLWVGFSLCSIASFFLVHLLAASLLGNDYKGLYSIFAQKLVKNRLILIGVNLLLTVGIYTVTSIVLASWGSRWVDKEKKGTKFVIPSFKVRFWHCFRFMCPLGVIMHINGIIQEIRSYNKIEISEIILFVAFVSPYLISISTYVCIISYDYWRKGEKKYKRERKKRKRNRLKAIGATTAVIALTAFLGYGYYGVRDELMERDLFEAVNNKGSIETVRKMILKWKFSKETIGSALMKAAEIIGNEEVVRELLQEEPSVVDIGYALLYAAKIRGNEKVVRELLQGEPSEVDIGYALWDAAKIRGNEKVVRELLQGEPSEKYIDYAKEDSNDQHIKQLLQEKLNEMQE